MKRLLILISILGLLLAACGGDDKDKDNKAGEQYTIGIINLSINLESVITGFKTQMAELGYIEGENITYIYDGPPASITGLDELAQKLVEADVDLILCVSTPATQAVQRATAEKPIPSVFAVVQDPIGSGIVSSLTEPGGNATGITFGPAEGKRLEWLTRAVPGIKRVYIPYNDDDPAPHAALVLVSEAAEHLDVELVLQPAHGAEEIDAAIKNIPDDVDAIMILPDSIVSQRITDLAALAIERKLPFSVTVSDNVVAAGALISFGMETEPVGQQAARLADQVLKGTKPSDLPVEVADFFLTINLKTATALGIEIPDSVLRQADIIIRDEE
ncbi:MAG: ABC transporter substrate-binding protein [Anaerolineae bacterium]|nr:ABC transporter substrate-binding protein [Anaerolineae bacterium]